MDPTTKCEDVGTYLEWSCLVWFLLTKRGSIPAAATMLQTLESWCVDVV